MAVIKRESAHLLSMLLKPLDVQMPRCYPFALRNVTTAAQFRFGVTTGIKTLALPNVMSTA